MGKVSRKPPEIDYLAKDYASFRSLMLDRLSQLVPDWREQSPADLGHAVVEVLAYAADYLSYYQDAVATEAYLGTARLRRSVRRHARLLDYQLHEGCNARVWVQIQVNEEVKEEVFLPTHTQLLTRVAGLETPVIRPEEAAYQQALQEGVTVFETMHHALLRPARNEIPFFCENNTEYLPRGATSACLKPKRDGQGQEMILEGLKPGDVLIFEELRDPRTGFAAGADPAHRHAVRLTEVRPMSQEPYVVEIKWAAAEALPFALYIAPYFDGRQEVAISVARGNVVLADHGRMIEYEELPVVQYVRYRPCLRSPNLPHAVPLHPLEAHTQPASAAMQYNPQDAVGWVRLRQRDARCASSDHDEMAWTLRRDLLSSSQFDRDYLIEMEEDGAAYLRFGFEGMGKLPLPGDRFVAAYRSGNGTLGNVSADTIAHVVAGRGKVPEKAITCVRNPLAAQGGCNPEDIESARLNAPHAFLTQQRCVTEADYAAVASRHPAVARAVAQRCGNGCGHTVVVYAQRALGQSEDKEFLEDLSTFMEPCRLLGHQIKIEAPTYVDVSVKLCVYLKPRAFALTVHQGLHKAFSKEIWPDGEKGFFYPGRFGFGQSVHQSQVIARAMSVPGVERVEVEQFMPADPADETKIYVEPVKIARLDCIDFEFEEGQ